MNEPALKWLERYGVSAVNPLGAFVRRMGRQAR
jgi:hypothetical protein